MWGARVLHAGTEPRIRSHRACVSAGSRPIFDQLTGQISISYLVKYLTSHLVKMGGVVDGDGRWPVGRLQLRYYKYIKYYYIYIYIIWFM